MDGSEWIIDGITLGQNVRALRLDQGLSPTELANAMQSEVPELSVTAEWVVWVESGLIPTVDENLVIAAALALTVPVSRLILPPASSQNTTMTVREQLQQMGMTAQGIAEVSQWIDVDAYAPIWQCSLGRLGDELWGEEYDESD